MVQKADDGTSAKREKKNADANHEKTCKQKNALFILTSQYNGNASSLQGALLVKQWRDTQVD